MATEALNILYLHRDADQARRVEEYILRASGGRARVESAVIPAETADLAFQERPQIVVLSLDKPNPRDLAYVSNLVSKIPSAALVVLAGRADPCQAARIREAGALECLIGECLDSDRLWPTMSAAQAGRAEFGEGLYRSIVENQSDLICRFSAEGAITFVNQAFCKFFGQPAAGLPRTPFPDLIAPEDRSMLWDHLLGLDPKSPLTRVELRCNSRRLGQRWLGWSLTAFFNERGDLVRCQAVGADITERKRVESALLVAESSLRQLFMSNADGMVVTSPAGEILFVNPAAEELLGDKGFDLLGKKFEFSLAPGQRREIVLKGGPAGEVVVEMRVVHTKWRRRDAYLASLRDITELVKLRERLRSLSLVDDLTLLYNRRGFVTLARQQMKTANRMGRSLMLFFLDMDDLKRINDRHGHAQGDQAIKEAAMLLKATFRESDILCRFGGDEFVALAMEDGGDANVIMRRLYQNVEDWSNDAKRPYRLSFSMGAAVYSPAQPQTLEDLVAQADAAMYENKCARKAAQQNPGDPNSAAAV